jgi:hypothetical protein
MLFQKGRGADTCPSTTDDDGRHFASTTVYPFSVRTGAHVILRDRPEHVPYADQVATPVDGDRSSRVLLVPVFDGYVNQLFFA